MFKTPYLVDRRVFDKRGKWQNPNNDIPDNIFYFIKDPLTLSNGYVNGREELKEEMTITVFGSKPICVKDKIYLDTGTQFEVVSITLNFAEHNVLVKDILKPRVVSMDLVLE